MFYIWLRLVEDKLQDNFIKNLRDYDCDFFVQQKEVVIKVKEMSIDSDYITLDLGGVTFGFKLNQVYSMTYF